MTKQLDLSAKLKESQRILICPLDWGLGHASRCVPIINHLLEEGKEVKVASSGTALSLLQKRFPSLVFYELPAYNIKYPSRWVSLNFIYILPNLLQAIFGEYYRLKQILRKENFDVVISDNRLGCWNKKCFSIYITHQLRFAFRQKWSAGLAAKLHAFWYWRFDEIWVPDFPPPDNLTGKLAVPLPGSQVTYLGPLSQLSKKEERLQYDAAAVLSGPEPQRSYLEREILKQFSALTGQFVLVRGLLKGDELENTAENVKVISLAGADELSTIMAQSQLVICRSGYSSIMDLYKLDQKGLLVPTPGQPEQEYLAAYHADKGQFIMQKQGALNIEKVLEELSK
jgi:uncharacterized protein (TIGR00661 family)